MTETTNYNPQHHPIDPEQGGRRKQSHTITDLFRRLVRYDSKKRSHNPPTPYIPSNN